ncbi:mucin-2 [Nerophis ophidion]|uniref:mucin-2 n=1 Tax=Nerophis ophidion TaxID=159077 RepID=UPI002ADF15A5|nr:mucin-2 [Nerophis ophidion]
MDVQTDNMDPAPCESSGKIRKGFKLFGKRKPGSIFSMKNNKSPVIRSQTHDGLPEGASPDSESEADKEKAQGVSQGDSEYTEEELTDEMAAARNSISSTSSAKSLSFFSRLKGARRGGGDRKVHTISQPVRPQRQGLKSLFDSVKFRSKDKEDKVDAPLSPLLMSSRSNSVEIIKEDLSLTPKSHPRSLESPEKVSNEATQSSPTAAGDMKDGKVAPESSLGSLLEDISSLLTFESISGGDIMAGVEAEWGKVKCATSSEAPEVSASTTSHLSRLTSATPTTCTSSPVATPPIMSTFSKPSTFTTQSLKPSSYSALTFEQPSIGITIKSANIKPSFTLMTSTSPPKVFTPSVTMTATTTTFKNQASVNKTSLNSTDGQLASLDTATHPRSTLTSVSKPIPEATPPLFTIVKPATPHPASPFTFNQLANDFNLQTSNYTKLQNALAKDESASNTKPPFISTITTVMPSVPSISIPAQSGILNRNSIPLDCAQPESSPPRAKQSLTSLDTTSHAKGLSPVSLSKTPSLPVTVSKDPPASAYIPVSGSPSVGVPSSIDAPASAHVPVAVSKSPHALDNFTISLSKGPPALAHIPVPVSKSPPSMDNVPVTLSKCPSAAAHVPVSLSKGPPTLVLAPDPVSKCSPAPANIPVPVSKSPPALLSEGPPALAHVPVTLSKGPPTLVLAPDPVSKCPPAPVNIPVPVSKSPPALLSEGPPALAHVPVTLSKGPPTPVLAPVSVSKISPTPAHVPGIVLKCPLTLTNVPVTFSDSSSALNHDPKSHPVSAQITISPTKSSPSPVTSLPTSPVPLPSEAAPSNKMMASEAPTNGQLSSPGSTDAQSAKVEEQLNGSRMDLSKERRTQVRAVSKIPVVGGARTGKQTVRDSHHAEDESSRDPPTPVFEENRPILGYHDTGSRDKGVSVEVHVQTTKHSQEQSQLPHQSKQPISLPRDSRIPIKHGASQIPQARESPRTKIPVSKVPVRRVGNKPPSAGGTRK